MAKPVLVFWGMFSVLLGLVFLLSKRRGNQESEILVVHCAAGLQKPVRAIVLEFEKNRGVRVDLNVAGSGVLGSQVKVAGGDLYIPADDSYILQAQSEGLVEESMNLVKLQPVLVVKKGNPKRLQTLNDRSAQSVRLSMPDTSAAIGKYVYEVLNADGKWVLLGSRVVVMKSTVNQVVEDVAYGATDATFAWGAVAAQYDEVETIHLEEFKEAVRYAPAGVLKGGNTQLARELMHYLASSKFAHTVYEDMGYESLSGEADYE